MRIALVSLHFAEYSLQLARALAKDHDVLLILREDNFESEIGDSALLNGLQRLRVRLVRHPKRPHQVLPRAWELIRAIKSFKPEVIHAQEDTRDYLALALPFLPSVPFVLTVHDPKAHSGDDARRRARTRHGLYSLQLRRKADAVIIHGDRLINDARQVFPTLRDRIFTIPHGPLGILAAEPFPPNWTPGHFLFFGRIEAYKGLPVFVQAVRQLRAEGQPVVGVIAGRGTELERSKEALKQDDAFIVKDWFLTPQEVLACFSQANAVVMPYLDATQSGVAAYALGLGRALVASNVGALPEMARPDETGLLVPPGDSAALATALKRLLQDQHLSRRLAAGAVALGAGEFSWDEIARRTSRCYGALLTRDAQAGVRNA